MRDITPLVAPRSIAVIGASANPTKSGGVLFDNLVKGNFRGPLYPINRTATQIMGKTAYPTLADVDELDFLHFVAADPTTKVIGLYIESIRNPRAFFEQAREVRKSKPIVVLKPGRTKDGAKASASHTGSLASDNDILEGALRQYGIARAEDEDDFLNALRALVMLPRPRGKRVGIATTSGALGVIATDLLVEGGLELAAFEPATLAAMRTILPDWLEPANPFDFWISIDVKGPREAHEVG